MSGWGWALWIVVFVCFVLGRLAAWLRPRALLLATKPNTLAAIATAGAVGMLVVAALLVGTLMFDWAVPVPWSFVHASVGGDVPDAEIANQPPTRVINIVLTAVWIWVFAWMANRLLIHALLKS